MKDKDSVKSAAISFLRAEMKNCAIEAKKEKLDDKEIEAIIKRQVKRIKESIEQFDKGGRKDLVEKESKNLQTLSAYLPKQLSEADVTKIIDEVISSKGEVSMKEMGAIIKEVMAKAKGAADGKMVSEIVKSKIPPPQ